MPKSVLFVGNSYAIISSQTTFMPTVRSGLVKMGRLDAEVNAARSDEGTMVEGELYETYLICYLTHMFHYSSVSETYNEVKMKYSAFESSTLEFKKTLPENDQIVKTVIGFCNRYGGKLVVGVDAERNIVGVSENEIQDFVFI